MSLMSLPTNAWRSVSPDGATANLKLTFHSDHSVGSALTKFFGLQLDTLQDRCCLALVG
jgi:hypothetical protein